MTKIPSKTQKITKIPSNTQKMTEPVINYNGRFTFLLSIYIYIYIYKTETFETPTIFYINTILKKKNPKKKNFFKPNQK